MPGLDRTGPMGQGSRTGRETGKCVPGQENNEEDRFENWTGRGARGIMGRGHRGTTGRVAGKAMGRGSGRGAGRGRYRGGW